MAQASGMSVEEILDIRRGPEEGKARKRKSPKPKYANPSTGETWSGRGRMPRWLADLAGEKGIDLKDTNDKEAFLQPFLIEQPSDETKSED